MTKTTRITVKKRVAKKRVKAPAKSSIKPGRSKERAIKSKTRPAVNKTEQVDAFMAQLEHPLKAEAEAVRKIIKGVNKNITEEIKWVAPSFSYKGYLVTFNLRALQHVHLVFHNGAILTNKKGLLQGDYPDRRMMYFNDMKDVKAKKGALKGFVREWIRLMDNQAKN